MDDRELLEAWQAGDRKAGDQLLKRHFPSLRKFFLNKAPPQATDDLIQEALMRCHSSLQSFRGEASFRTYLFRIARNTLNDHYRKQSKQPEEVDFSESSVADYDSSPGPLTSLARRHEEKLLLLALRQIPIDDQIMLELYFWEKLTAKEIGEIFDMGEPAIRGRIKRAKDALFSEIGRLARTPQEVKSTVDNLDKWAERVRARFYGGDDDDDDGEGAGEDTSDEGEDSTDDDDSESP